MAATLTRTYETFAVKFARGTRVSGFDTRDEAERYLGTQAGEVERTTFDVTFDADKAHLYQPGIATDFSDPDLWTVAPAHPYVGKRVRYMGREWHLQGQEFTVLAVDGYYRATCESDEYRGQGGVKIPTSMLEVL